MSTNDPTITPIPASPPPGSYVTDLRTNDILCGRGSGPNDHIGNINFRELIALERDNYLGTSSRVGKNRIAIAILNHVRSKVPPGRFLERVSGKGKSNAMWIVVTEDKAMEKIKQALRQIRNRAPQAKKTDIAIGENLGYALSSNPPPLQPNDTYSNASVKEHQIDTVYSSASVASSQSTNGKIIPQEFDTNPPPTRDPTLYPPICVHLIAKRMKDQAEKNKGLGPLSPLPDEPTSGFVSSISSPMSSQINDYVSDCFQLVIWEKKILDFFFIVFFQLLLSHNSLRLRLRLKNDMSMKMTHRQIAQNQFQKKLGHDEAPITEESLSREIEPRSYIQQSSGDISAIGDMRSSEIERLMNSASMSIVDIDEVVSQTFSDGSSKLTGDTTSMRKIDQENIDFPKPKVNPYTARLNSEQSSMSMDFLTSSFGDVTIDESMTSSQERIRSRLMSEVSMDRTIFEETLQNGNQDSLSSMNQVLQCMDSIEPE